MWDLNKSGPSKYGKHLRRALATQLIALSPQSDEQKITFGPSIKLPTVPQCVSIVSRVRQMGTSACGYVSFVDHLGQNIRFLLLIGFT